MEAAVKFIVRIILLSFLFISLQIAPSFAGATDPSITGTGLTGTCNDNKDCAISISIPENSTWTGTYGSNMSTNWSIPTSGPDSEKDYGFFSLSGAGPSSSVTVTLSARDFENKLDDGSNNSYKVGIVALKAGGAAGDKSVFIITITITNIDDTAPVLSGSNSLSVPENTSSAATIATYTADEAVTSWGLEGDDATSFAISSGALTFVSSPDYETKTSYSITVTATDTLANKGTRSVSITITDVDEVAPIISGSTTPSIVEGAPTSTVIATYTADEAVTSWGLEGDDATSFAISSGALTFVSSPDYETDAKTSYSITITATDSNSNKGTLAVTVSITDVDEVAPIIECDGVDCGGMVTKDVPENATGSVVYSFGADEEVTWSIENCTAETCASGDKNFFSIDSSGDLTMNSVEFDPSPGAGEGNDNSYTVVVVATDTSGNVSTLEFNVNVTEVDDVAPMIMGAATISVDENQDASTVLETYSANEGVTWAVEGADSASFSINSSGELRLVAAADYETTSSYSIVITATDAASNSTSYAVGIEIVDVTESDGGGNDDEQEPSEDNEQAPESRLVKAVNDMHSSMRSSLVSTISLSGIRSMENPANLIYLAAPGLTSENVLRVHQLFVDSNSGDSLESFLVYASKHSIVSRLATVGLTMGVTFKELQTLGLVNADPSVYGSLIRAIRAVPVSERDTVEELEKAIATILARL
jgi:hypothetical protein